MKKDNKAVWKTVILALCSFFGITNIISLFIVAKKLHSKFLNITAMLSAVGIIASFVALSSSDASSLVCALAVICIGICCVLPSVLTLINLSKYKCAADLECTLKMWSVNPDNIKILENVNMGEISWINTKQLKVAKQVYGQKGLTILNEINSKMKYKAEQDAEQREKERLLRVQKEADEKKRLETEKLEKEKKEREQREFELAKIQAEKDKAEAEARALQLKKENDDKLKEEKARKEKQRQEREQREFELAKLQAEKEKAEAEAKALQLKKEEDEKSRLRIEREDKEEKERQQREFELAKLQAEKDKAEAEAKALQIKKEAEEAEIKKMKIEKEKICDSCGKELLNGADFCVYCGAKKVKSE